ncbi:MAG: hypothetical protein WDA00_06485 [Eubacteriales bacterium]
MSFLSVWWFDVLLGAIALLHIAGCFFKKARTILAVVNICLHIAVFVALLSMGGGLDEAMVILMASTALALAINMREERRETP